MPETTSTAGTPIARLRRRLILGVVSLIAATAVWLPCLHFLYWPPLPPPKNDAKSSRSPRGWPPSNSICGPTPNPASGNWRRCAGATPSGTSWAAASWSWALANRSLRHPEQKAACLEVMDRIIDETLKTEQERGMYHFLMPYARNRPFRGAAAAEPVPRRRDGADAGARRLVAEKEAYREPLRQASAGIVRRMEAGPVLCRELPGRVLDILQQRGLGRRPA